MQMGRQNRSGNPVILKERLLHTQRERKNKTKNNKTKNTKTTKTKQQQNKKQKQQQETKNKNKKCIKKKKKKRETDELLMFIVGKDSALFSGLRKLEVARPSDSNVRAFLSVRLSFGEYPLVGI